MPVRIKPLTRAQLREFFSSYRGAFPGWEVEEDVVLVRSSGPVKQRIAFERLRDGAYRPSCSVEIRVSLGVRILHRFLDVKNREILPRDHAVKVSRVLKAMEEQFQPSIRSPLDAREVLHLGEQEVLRNGIENMKYFNGLAGLSAYLGAKDSARHWLDRARELLSRRAMLADWERRQAEFTEELGSAMHRGQEQAFLEAVLATTSDPHRRVEA